MMRALLSFLVLCLLPACGAGDPTFVRLGDYECDASEALVRHLIKTLPPIAPTIPKEFCVVKALDLRSTDLDFSQRFADLKLPFVSRDVLSEQQETHYPVNPKSGLSPILIHLQKMKRLSPESYEIEAGWAYKRTFERKRFLVEKSNDVWTVKETATLESNVSS